MRVEKWFWITLVALSGNVAVEAQSLETTISKSEDGSWHVSFQSDEPLKQIALLRNPDGSRINRWLPADNGVQIVRENGIEIIRRNDGSDFSKASFALTPTYTHLPKDYAPFSPFSDGGTLFHSGRFFACVDQCSEDDHWLMNLEFPIGDIAIVNGRVVSGKQFWVDSKSGTNIYVGSAKPVVDKYFISVIDSALPQALRFQLNNDLPELIEYFAARLPGPETKPMLFASYHDTDDGRYGRQGGVLPNQIFMHWYGSQSLEQSNENSTLFFFAHEVAHLFQGRGMEVENPEEYWVSEGSADFMAGFALAEIHPEGEAIMAAKLADAKEQCLVGLRQEPDFNAALAGDFKLHYSCGMVIHSAINESLQQTGKMENLLDLWAAFDRRVSEGSEASGRTYLALAKPSIDKELFDKINRLLFVPEADAVMLTESL